MGRILTTGFEVTSGAAGSTEQLTAIDGRRNNTNSQASITTANMRSGAQAGFIGQQDASTGYWEIGFTGALERIYYFRVYMRFSAFPTADCDILACRDSTVATVIATVKMRATTGQLALYDGATQIGSDSASLTANTYYRIEFKVKQSASASSDQLELQLDGVQVAVDNARTLTATATPGSFRMGLTTSGFGTFNQWLDDVALNDDQGASQNTFPGDGNVVLLKPTSDSQRGSWTGGVGGTTNLFAAVDNVPPAGTATETDTSQIESADGSGNNTTDEYRANMTDYTTAGIAAADTINVVQAFVNDGEDVATGTKTGSYGIFSNPAEASGGATNTFTYGDDVGALGTYPANWRYHNGAQNYAPSVTLGTSPVMAVRKTDAGTRVASIDFMGIYVDYTPRSTFVPRNPAMDFGMAVL